MKIKFRKLVPKKPFPILLIILFITAGVVTVYAVKKSTTLPKPESLESEGRLFPESLFRKLLEKGEITPTPTPTPKSTAMPTPTSKPKTTPKTQPTLTPTSTPTNTPTPTPRIPSPPIINISYPSEMQYIEMGEGQALCVVDTPAGGDTSGLQRKRNINDGGWSEYMNMFTLCFDPIEGLNWLHLQYKNSYGDESTVYTRQFNFHRI